MKKTVSVKGKIALDGKGISFDHSDVLSTFFLPQAGVDVDLDITFGKVKRSLAQNRYLWGVCYVVIHNELKNRTGENMPAEVIHAHNLQVIQGVKVASSVISGQTVLIVKDKKSSDMTVEEFTEMITKLKDWYAINQDIFIPEMVGDATLNDYL